MKETIAIDMDEVLADPATKMIDWYEKDFGLRFTEEELHGKDLKDIVPEARRDIFKKYLNTPGFFRDLELIPYAQEVVEELNNKYQLFIVSAAMEFPNSLKDKYDWLEEHFPFLHWQQICLCGSKSIVQTDYMIDDRIKNFTHFQGTPLLYTAHHNLLETRYERVQDWQEVAKRFL